MDDDDILEQDEGENMGTIVLMLGLYLIVLAFFILLNAISVISEEKVEQATESLSSGFGFQMSGEVRMRDDVDVTLDPVFDVIAQEIEELMDTYVSVKDYKMRSDASKMVLRINTEKIFPPGQVRILPDMAGLFAELANIIHAPRPGTTMVSDIRVVNTPKDLDGRDMDLLHLAGRRASLFVRALEERGVASSAMSAGALAAKEGEDSEVQIYFEVLVLDHKRAMKEARRMMFGDEAADSNIEPQAGPANGGDQPAPLPDFQPPVQSPAFGPQTAPDGMPLSQ